MSWRASGHLSKPDKWLTTFVQRVSKFGRIILEELLTADEYAALGRTAAKALDEEVLQ
jgi:hypothetical protein